MTVPIRNSHLTQFDQADIDPQGLRIGPEELELYFSSTLISYEIFKEGEYLFCEVKEFSLVVRSPGVRMTYFQNFLLRLKSLEKLFNILDLSFYISKKWTLIVLAF